MTPDPRDELAHYTTPRGWTREDADALLDAALIRWNDNIELPPTDPPRIPFGWAYAIATATQPPPPPTQAVLSTEQPFPISYTPEAWEQLHPINEPRAHPRQTLYLTSGRARTRE